MPTTTTGVATTFIDFTRASNATVTDSDGKVKWAPHNLLTNSESFDAASWTKDNLLAFGSGSSANAIGAPNATTTADLITPDTTGTMHRIFMASGITVPTATPHTYGVFVRANGYTKVALRENATTGDYAAFELTGAGSVLDKTVGATASVSALSNSWYYITATFSSAATAITLGVYVLSPSYTTGSILGVWVANGTSGIYLWGASLYRSDLGGMQPNTSAYPLYNPTTPKNLLGYTESLTTGWTNSNTTDAIVSEVNPVGLTGAVDVAATAGNGTLLGSLSLLASPYTFSIWLKRKTGSGTVEITVDGTTYVAAAVTSTWTRFSTTLTPTAGTKTPGIRLVTSGDAVYAWGAQLSDSASLDSYVPVYGAAVTSAAYYGPRRDFDPVTLACKGLLVEEQRVNLMTYSSEFDNAAWGKANLNTTGTPPYVNVQTAPDGNLSADKLIESNTTAQHYTARNATVTSGSTYTLSFYLRAGERTWALVEFYGGIPAGLVYINLSTGDKGTTTGSASAVTVTDVGGNWWRVVLPGFVASSTTPAFAVYTSTGNGVNSYAGDGTSGLYIWGAQLDSVSGGNAPFATSYIPTGSASATRNADVASVSTQAFPYSATEGTVVVNASSPCIAAIANMITLDNGTTQERIRLLTDVASVKTIVTESNTTQANLSPGSATANTPFKFAVAYKVNDFAAVVNGSAAATDAAGNVPVVNIARLGADSSGNYLNGHIRQITYLPRRISNADLVTRST